VWNFGTFPLGISVMSYVTVLHVITWVCWHEKLMWCLSSLCSCCLLYRVLVYLQTGQLNEYTERKEMPSEAVCMALANVPPGEQRCRFLAVGLADNTVRIISLDPAVSFSTLYFAWRSLITQYRNCLQAVCLKGRPSFCCLLIMFLFIQKMGRM